MYPNKCSFSLRESIIKCLWILKILCNRVCYNRNPLYFENQIFIKNYLKISVQWYKPHLSTPICLKMTSIWKRILFRAAPKNIRAKSIDSDRVVPCRKSRATMLRFHRVNCNEQSISLVLVLRLLWNLNRICSNKC